MYSWVRNWRAWLTVEAILEMCSSGQLSPLLKQQTTSARQHPDLCVSGMLRPSITRQDPPTASILSQTWTSYFCLIMRYFPLPSSLERSVYVTAHLSWGGRHQVILRLAWFGSRFALRFKGIFCVLSQPAVKPQEDKLILVPISPLGQKSIPCLPSQCWPKLNRKSIEM